jgi:hypothetical protein
MNYEKKQLKGKLKIQTKEISVGEVNYTDSGLTDSELSSLLTEAGYGNLASMFTTNSSNNSSSSSTDSIMNSPEDEQYKKEILSKFDELNGLALRKIENIMKTNGDNAIAAYIQWEKENGIPADDTFATPVLGENSSGVNDSQSQEF